MTVAGATPVPFIAQELQGNLSGHQANTVQDEKTSSEVEAANPSEAAHSWDDPCGDLAHCMRTFQQSRQLIEKKD